MSEDRFEEAVRALRDEGKPSADDVRRVRRRVLESLASPEAKRRRLSPWLLPIAATLAATTALAATGTLSTVLHAITHTQETPAVSSPPVPVPVPVPAPTQAAAPTPSAEPEPAPTVSIVPAPPRSSSSPPSSPSTSATSAAERIELQHYRTAHALHFTARDYAAALPAWDAYLAAHPSGALVHEARYNRAICLLELGRTSEAATALEPFANGAVAGGYRKTEARSLLEAMDAGR